MQIISCDCQPNCNCLITCDCDTNLLLSCVQKDEPKFDLISAYTPDAQPTVNTPEIKPTVNTPEIKPSTNNSRQTNYYPAKPSNTKRYVRPTTRRTTKSASSSSCYT